MPHRHGPGCDLPRLGAVLAALDLRSGLGGLLGRCEIIQHKCCPSLPSPLTEYQASLRGVDDDVDGE